MMTGSRRWLARLLILVGVVVLAWAGYAALSARWAQREYQRVLDVQRALPPPEAPKPVLPVSMPLGEPIGTLFVPRLGLSAVVAEGDDKPLLDDAAGHLPDTALPWNDGNTAVAAHRDGLFRPLKGIRVGDRLRFETVHGDFEYLVKETYIVDPDDIWVLNPTLEPTLTLISCYPFNFIGNAPRRFIVKAQRVPVIEATSSNARPSRGAGTPQASTTAGG